MGWPSWLLLSAFALAALFILAAWLIRFRYAFEYVFPNITRGSMALSFLWWRKEMPIGSPDEEDEDGDPRYRGVQAVGERVGAASGSTPRDSAAGGPPGPRPGQDGFLALPWKERKARIRSRLKAASLKWVLDLRVWRHLAGYLLGSGLRILRWVGPSMEHLHVGSANILALGRFASTWATMGGMVPFLACPVEYGFNERPFALRLRISGRCTALGVLAMGAALLFTVPWIRLAGRFRYCWRHPRLNRWQRRLVAAAA